MSDEGAAALQEVVEVEEEDVEDLPPTQYNDDDNFDNFEIEIENGEDDANEVQANPDGNNSNETGNIEDAGKENFKIDW